MAACLFTAAFNAQVNYYVSATGSDTNDGLSEAAPMASVGAAYAAATASYTADQTETVYNVNVGAGTFETSNLAIASLGGLSITIKGEGANLTTLQGGATMPTEVQLFTNPTGNTANQQLKIYLEDLKINNYGFSGTTAGSIIFLNAGAAKNIYFSAARCAFSNLQSKDGAVIKSNHLTFMTFSECSFVDIKAINNDGVWPIFNIVRGNLTMENCFFARCTRDYTIVDGTTTESNEEGFLIKSKPLYNWVANDINLINNTFVDCGLVKGDDVTVSHTQSLIHLHNPHEGTKGSGGTINAVIANNLIIGTTLEGIDASSYVDIYVNNTDPSPGDGSNDIVLTNCTNNVMQTQSGFGTTGNNIDPAFTYTSTEIDFTMDGNVPQEMTTANGISYAVANGTAIKQQGATGDFVPVTDITGADRLSPTTIGAYEAGTATAIPTTNISPLAIYSTSGQIIVEGETSSIKVYNTIGILQSQQTAKQGLTSIPVENQGIYIVVASTLKGETVSKKVRVK